MFGPAHQVGIKLTPRIRNWQAARFARPSRGARYQQIDTLFSDPIEWDLIERHWLSLLQVALSSQAGTVSSALLLRKPGTYSRLHRLYQAFSELGRVVRTVFLLHDASEPPLREQSTATCATDALTPTCATRGPASRWPRCRRCASGCERRRRR